MLDKRTDMLVATVRKLYRRGAKANVQKVLFKTHTADVAALLEDLEPEERLGVFRLEKSPETRAEIISYLKPEYQKELAENLKKAELTTVVGLMDSDDAADFLGHLPEDQAKSILDSMANKDSEDVGELMGYPEDSAGGLMSTDVLALNKALKVSDAIKKIQDEENESLVAFYIYVVDEANHLIGVVSLKQLLLSKARETLSAIMSTEVISVDLETDQQEVAKAVARYDFLAIPVVDGANKIVGVITVDDVVDVIREEAEENLRTMAMAGQISHGSFLSRVKGRLPWLLVTFVGASICFVVINYFTQKMTGGSHELWLLAAFLPIILAMGATTGGQAATVIIAEMVTGDYDPKKWWADVLQEFLLSLVYAAVFALLVTGLGRWLFDSQLVAVASGALALQIVFSMVVGTLVPVGMNKLGMDATFALVPLFTAVADIAAVSMLFGMAWIYL